MGAMAVGAIRRILHVVIVSLTVATFEIPFEHFCMTRGTVYRFIGRAGTFQVIVNFGMAFGTLDVFMNRVWQDIRINKKGVLFIINHFMNVLLLVALHAGIVREPGLDLRYIYLMGRVAFRT